MSGLRERKKSRTRESIVQSAKRLFLSRGYAATSMSGIAADCEVGVGTLYNYYKSKSDLLLEMFREDLPDLSDRAEAIARDDALSLRDKLRSVITLFWEVFHHFPRSFYRELLAVLFTGKESGGDTFRGLADIDRQSMALIAAMLEQGKKNGELPASYAIDQAIGLLYSALVMQIMAYLLNDEATEEEGASALFAQLDFLLGIR